MLAHRFHQGTLKLLRIVGFLQDGLFHLHIQLWTSALTSVRASVTVPSVGLVFTADVSLQIYRILGKTVVCYPIIFDLSDFYMSQDVLLLIDDIKVAWNTSLNEMTSFRLVLSYVLASGAPGSRTLGDTVQNVLAKPQPLGLGEGRVRPPAASGDRWRLSYTKPCGCACCPFHIGL